MIKKNTNVELRMIVLEERSGVVSPAIPGCLSGDGGDQ